MTLGRFSIVTAVRNASATIADTLASVATQTHAEKEHIVQDGRSTDGTADIVRRVGTEIVRLESSRDSGVYDAFNRGLARTTGDFVSFLGADDMFEGKNVLSEVAEAFSDPAVDLVFGDIVMVKRDDVSRVVRYYRSGAFRGLSSLQRGFMPGHPATFVRRRLYQRVGNFKTEYRIAGDFEWFVRAFSGPTPNFVHLDKALVRMRTGGLSSAGPRATWQITREIYRACVSNSVPSSYLTLLGRLPVKALELLRR